MMTSLTARRYAAITAAACLLTRGTATNHAGEGAAPAASPPFPVLPVAQSSAQVMSSPPALSYPGAASNKSYLALGMEMPILATAPAAAGAGAGASDSAELIFVSPQSYLLFVQQGMILDGSTQLNMSGGLLSSSADPFVSFQEPTGLFSSVSAANSGSSPGSSPGSSSPEMRLLAVLLYSPPNPQPGAAAFNWTAWAADMSANPSLRINFDLQDFATRSGLGEPVAAEVLIVEDQVTSSSDNPDGNSQSLVPVSTVIPAAGPAESGNSNSNSNSNIASASSAASATAAAVSGGAAGGSPPGLGALLPGAMPTGGDGGLSQSSSAAGASGTGAASAGSAAQSGSGPSGSGSDGASPGASGAQGNGQGGAGGSGGAENSGAGGAGSGGQGDAENGAGGAGSADAAGSNKDKVKGSPGGAGSAGASGDGADGESAADDESGCDPGEEQEQGAGDTGAAESGSAASGNSTMAMAMASATGGGNKKGLGLMGTAGMTSTDGEMGPSAPKITAAAGTGDGDDGNDFVIGFDIDGKFGTTITADLPFRAARRSAGPQEDGDWTMTLNTDARLALGGLMQATAVSTSDSAIATGSSTMMTTTTTSGLATLATATTPASSATSASTSLSSTVWPSSAFRVMGLVSVALAVLTFV